MSRLLLACSLSILITLLPAMHLVKRFHLLDSLVGGEARGPLRRKPMLPGGTFSIGLAVGYLQGEVSPFIPCQRIAESLTRVLAHVLGIVRLALPVSSLIKVIRKWRRTHSGHDNAAASKTKMERYR